MAQARDVYRRISALEKGDHIFVKLLPLNLATHHGIYVGDGTVVHWTSGSDDFGFQPTKNASSSAIKRDGSIRRTSLREFAGDQGYVRVRQNTHTQLDRDEAVARALERVGETGYSLLFNNCEHFATECWTGKSDSAQVRLIGRTVGKLVEIPLIVGVAKLAGKSGSRIAVKGVTPLVAVDAAEITLELLAINHLGMDPEEARTLACGTSLAGHVGIGALCAGPLGVGVSLALWAVGHLAGGVVERVFAAPRQSATKS